MDKISETYFKIKKTIISKQIDTIFYPTYEGGHQDHDVANFICSRLKKMLTNKFPLYEIHLFPR